MRTLRISRQRPLGKQLQFCEIGRPAHKCYALCPLSSFRWNIAKETDTDPLLANKKGVFKRMIFAAPPTPPPIEREITSGCQSFWRGGDWFSWKQTKRWFTASKDRRKKLTIHREHLVIKMSKTVVFLLFFFNEKSIFKNVVSGIEAENTSNEIQWEIKKKKVNLVRPRRQVVLTQFGQKKSSESSFFSEFLV